MLYALGLGERVVAVSHECDFPPDATAKPRVTMAKINNELSSRAIDEAVRETFGAGGSLYEIDAELLVRLRPDLIVTQAQCDVCAVRYSDVLETVAANATLRGTPVVALNPTSLGEILADIRRVGAAAGAEQAADAVVAAWEARIERVQRGTVGLAISDRPRVACVEWIEPLMIAANWIPQLVELAGGRYELAPSGVHSAYHAWEEVVGYDPQVLAVMPCGFDLERTLAEAPLLAELPGWNDLSAVRAGRVFLLDGNAYFNRSGPRMVESLEILAHLIHPERFAQPALVEPWDQVCARWTSPPSANPHRKPC